MKTVSLSEGSDRTRISLTARPAGEDLIVSIFNENDHVGAVAVAEYSFVEDRASTSVITRFGHKDDAVAYTAAHRLCRQLKKPICVIAGIHLDEITKEEIAKVIKNCETLVDRLASMMDSASAQRL